MRNTVDVGRERAFFRERDNKRGWQSRQLHPGTRIVHYRCCLPALAGFANYRRGRTSGTTIDLLEAHDIGYMLYIGYRAS